MLDKEEIKKIIPQRDPFLMIDEVEEYVPGESAVAYKHVNENEWYFSDDGRAGWFRKNNTDKKIKRISGTTRI